MGSLREAARDRDWRGGLGLAHSRLGSVQISSYELSKFGARYPGWLTFKRERGAPPRDEPPVSYGVSARGRSRSRLARGAWSRSLQARLGTNFEVGFIEMRRPILPNCCPLRAREPPRPASSRL